MNLSDDFKTFVDKLELTNIEEMETTVWEIAKKLNTHYYEIDSKEEHMYFVGSVGRETAIKGVSDLDILFDLPEETYDKFNNYESNGQSALLQEVKEVLKEKYSRTKIRGDGQVVVIEFNKYTVELVPGFKQSDNSFRYPNTNNGGSWKVTKPLEEIAESIRFNNSTFNNNFRNVCGMLREWKNYQGFIFGGLLIDTLVYDFMNENISSKYTGYNGYLNLLKDLFSYFKNKDSEQSYWYALGSNQKVYNSGKGVFVNEAEKAYDKIVDLDQSSEDVNSILRELFGNKFPKPEDENKRFNELLNFHNAVNTEQFIEDYYPINIKYWVRIDCEVSQEGFRPHNLRYMLFNKMLLKIGKQLKFFITEMDSKLKEPYEIIWKVKNEGEEAIKTNQIRGQLIKNKRNILNERTSFRGNHYVECYIIKDDICVAKDKIRVSIST